MTALPSPHPRPGRRFGWAVAGALILMALLALTHQLWAVPRGLQFAHTTWADALLAFLTLPFVLHRAAADPEERLGWQFLALSCALSALSSVLALGVDATLLNALTFGQVETSIRFSIGLFVGAAVLAWPLAPASRSERLRTALDGVAFALALFFILWALAWGGLYRTSSRGDGVKLTTLAFPLLSTGLLGVAMYVGARNPARFRGPLGWVALSLLISFVGTLLWGRLALRGAYHVGHPLDLLAYAVPLTKALAALSPEPVGGPPADDELHDRSRFGWLLPYLPLIPAVAVAILRLLDGATQWDPVLIWTALGLGLAILLRQLLTLWDLRELSLHLERKVESRTEALEQSQALVLGTVRMNAMASLGAGLAHDLNNLLGAAGNYLELTLDDLASGGPIASRDLERVRQTLHRAGDLTRRLMAFGRTEHAEPKVFDLDQHIQEAAPILRLLLPKSVDLQLDLHPAPLLMTGLPAQLDQILVNLVSNARDAMPSGGRILIRTRLDAAGHILLDVEDTGTGMPPEVQARAFEPFYTTKPQGRGTGLGLSSVRTMVHQGGGDIRLESELGRGTRVTLAWSPC